jgi:hypothetical protein
MIGVPSKYAVPLLIIVHACNAIRAIKVDRTTIRAVPSFSRVAVLLDGECRAGGVVIPVRRLADRSHGAVACLQGADVNLRDFRRIPGLSVVQF